MSDLEFLYLLLVAFYLWECATWISPGGVAFVRWWGRHCRVAPLVGNQHGGFALAGPLPPLGGIFVGAQLPVSLAPEGVLAYVATVVSPGGRPPQTGRFVRWEEIQSISVRRKSIRINNELFVRAQSTIHARWLADALQQLARLPATERPAAIVRFIQSAFEAAQVKQRLSELDARLRPVRWTANVLFVGLFLIGPAVVLRFGIVLTWIYLLAGTLALTGTLAVLFHRAHLALHPRAEDERFAQGLMILLFPPAAIRAGDMLSRPLLECIHPLTVASVLCPPLEFESRARRWLLDLQHPALPVDTAHNTATALTESTSRHATLDAAGKMLCAAGLDPAKLMRPPPPADESCRAYCPRCHAQFTKLDARCADCGGMPVEAFGE